MDLASALLGIPQATNQNLQLRQGVVTQVSPLLVRVGAATTAQPCNALAGYSARVGDVVSVLVVDGDRLVLGSAVAQSTGLGVLARSFYNTTDQTVTVAAGRIAISGSPLPATVPPNRLIRLHAQMAVSAASLCSFRVVHSWNGTDVWTSQVELENGITNVVDFATPPLGLINVSANYAITCQAFTNTATIQHSTFQSSLYWVEDVGPA